MKRDSVRVKGELWMRVNGVLVRHVRNLIVDTGLAFLRSRMLDATSDVMSHMAIGSGSAPAAAGDTALGSEIARDTFDSITPLGSQVTYITTFPTAPAYANIAEAGIFNAGVAGTMLNRVVFDAFTKEAGDILEATWVIDFQ